MGTSVQMIENHYGHINPVRNAERILQGMPGWEPVGAAPMDGSMASATDSDRVNTDAAEGKNSGRKTDKTKDS